MEALPLQIDNETAIYAINLFTITEAQHHGCHLSAHLTDYICKRTIIITLTNNLFTWTYPTVYNVCKAYDTNRDTEIHQYLVIITPVSTHLSIFTRMYERNVIYVCMPLLWEKLGHRLHINAFRLVGAPRFILLDTEIIFQMHSVCTPHAIIVCNLRCCKV